MTKATPKVGRPRKYAGNFKQRRIACRRHSRQTKPLTFALLQMRYWTRKVKKLRAAGATE